MKLIVGLGNPGRRYAGTRHNVGFDVVDQLAHAHHADWESAPRGIEALIARWRGTVEAGFPGPSNVEGSRPDVVLAKPLTFMNLSGAAIVGLLQFYKVELNDLLVVVDDVNLELGRLRTRATGSAGGHNGLKSAIAQLGTEDFARMRIGIGRGDAQRDLADHVLTKFDRDEREDVEMATGRAADAVELFVTEGIGPVMNRFNRKEDGD